MGSVWQKHLDFSSVRIDTHPGNIPMQKLGKAGFERCGEIIWQVDRKGALRIGFERYYRFSKNEKQWLKYTYAGYII